MTIQQIKYVSEISRYGSISKAAQALYLTQPYLSCVLRELENELHITIFERTRSGVIPTEAGRDFLQGVRILLEQYDRILNTYKNHSSNQIFRFSISTQRYPFVVKSFFQFFQEKAPERFDIYLQECSMDQVIRNVFEKKSDLGIIFLSPSTESFILKYLSLRNLEFHEIISLPPRIVFRASHPMAVYDEIDLDDMSEYSYISFALDESMPLDFAEEIMFSQVASNSRRFNVNDRGTMINLLTHTDGFSMGIGILPSGFSGPQLVSRPIKSDGMQLRLGWIQPKGAVSTDDVLAFVDALRNVLYDSSDPEGKLLQLP